ncbi:hypothetical protein SUGI_0957390 [Cryptomeria japonica]|nr:hypothetical protein SUGI_0957390 [Cryptomeria japonica]
MGKTMVGIGTHNNLYSFEVRPVKSLCRLGADPALPAPSNVISVLDEDETNSSDFEEEYWDIELEEDDCVPPKKTKNNPKENNLCLWGKNLRDVLLFHSYSFTLNNPTRKQNLKKDHSGEDFTAECLTKLQLQISLVCQSTNQSAGIVELTYTSDIQHTRNTYRDLCSYINRYGASSDYLVNCGKRDSFIYARGVKHMELIQGINIVYVGMSRSTDHVLSYQMIVCIPGILDTRSDFTRSLSEDNGATSAETKY